jgi:hypothetical protein
MSWIFQPFSVEAEQSATYTLSVDVQQFVVTAPEIVLRRVRRLAASAGAYTATAMPVALKTARIWPVEGMTIGINAQDAGFSHDPVVVGEYGSVNCQPQPCKIVLARRLVAEHRLVQVIGQPLVQGDAPPAVYQSTDLSLSIGL